MNSILTALSGKKTFIIAGATILYCVLGVALHFMTIPAAVAFIGTTGSIAALRIGVSKAQAVLDIILEVLKLIGQIQQPIQAPKPIATVETGTPAATIAPAA